MKKFELTSEFVTNIFGAKLFRIKALVSFGGVEEGEIGGFVEKEENLDHSGDAWVYGNARVYGNAQVSGDAQVYGNARVYGDARVYGSKDYSCANGFGRFGRNTTFFKTKDGGVTVSCGCFSGSINKFREKVKETHKDTKLAKEYLMLADLMEYHFSEEE